MVRYEYKFGKTAVYIKSIKSVTVDKMEIADILNRHFESVFIKEPPDSLTYFENRTNFSFGIENFLSKINELEIEKRLNSLQESKSMGPDQIHPKILKECAKELAKPLDRESIKQSNEI